MITYNEVIDIENLEEAFKTAKRGKGHKKHYLEFSENCYYNLMKLHKDLVDRNYIPRESKTFTIKERGKERIITEPYFRDMIVQHAIHRKLEPLLEKRFSPYSYACRKNKGSHAAMKQAFNFYKNYNYFLKIDIRKYFHNVNNNLLLEKLSRFIKCEELNDLIWLFLSDKKGLPIGFLLSQSLANFYLTGLDNYLHHNHLRFVRYMDDVVIFNNDKKSLYKYKNLISDFIFKNLDLVYSNWFIHNNRQKLNFCGYIMDNKVLLLRKSSIKTIKKNFDIIQIHKKYVSFNHLNNISFRIIF